MPRIVTPLKLAIVASGLTQREVAAKVGLTEGQVSQLCRGVHTDDATWAKLARVLDRTPESIRHPVAVAGEQAA